MRRNITCTTARTGLRPHNYYITPTVVWATIVSRVVCIWHHLSKAGTKSGLSTASFSRTRSIALVLRLALARFVGLVAGGWYVSVAVGYWLAGEVGAMWARSSPMAGVVFLATVPLVGAVLMALIPARRSL